jgi:hypothetical protein
MARRLQQHERALSNLNGVTVAMAPERGTLLLDRCDDCNGTKRAISDLADVMIAQHQKALFYYNGVMIATAPKGNI